MSYEATEWVCGETITAEKLNKLERGVQSIMSDYVPTVWQCGDVITAERLNKLEQAVADFECGGGSSDLSTAVLHAVDKNGDDIMGDYNPVLFQGPFIGTIPINGGIECSFFNDTLGDGTLVLYKGCAFVGMGNIEWPVSSISGNIEDIGDGGYLVTGDCTIVFDTE